MNDQRRTRWAVIGTGRIASRFIEDMRHSLLGKVSAIGTRDIEKGKKTAAMIDSAVSVSSFEDIIRSKDIDAVYLATPNHLHKEQALKAIDFSKPVLIEKPIALNAEDAKQIDDASKKANILAMEAMWMRFTPGIQYMKSLIDNGTIGDVRKISASLAFYHEYDDKSNLFDPVNGGSLLDLGVYPISLAVYFLGSVTKVGATHIYGPNGSNIATAISLRHTEKMSSLSCGFDVEGPNDATLYGTRGVASTHRSMLCPSAVSFKPVQTPSRKTIETPYQSRRNFSEFSKMGAVRSLLSSIKVRPKATLFAGSGLHYQADHFTLCLRNGLRISPIMPLQDSVEVLRVVDEIRKNR